MILSYSAIACFERCPSQFYHRYILKDLKFESSPAIERGNKVHEALRRRLKHKRHLPADMPYEDVAASFDGKSLLVEEELGMREDGSATGYWDDDCYL